MISQLPFQQSQVPSFALQAEDLRIGIALGGGSARGYTHIGALASLEENDIYPDLISGTSFGAVIGVCYAMGKSIIQLKEDATNMRRRDIFPYIADFGLHKAALFSGDRLEHYYDRLLEGRHFRDLDKQLIVATTDIDTGELVLLKDGPLAPAIRASCSMPGVFAPVEINGRRLVDGGLAAPIPIDTLEGLELDLKLGVSAGTTSEDSSAILLTQKFLKTSLGAKVHQGLNASKRTHPLSRLGRGLAYTANTYMVDQCPGESLQVHANPPISWLHFHKAQQAITAGEKALDAFMPKILSALSVAQKQAFAGD